MKNLVFNLRTAKAQAEGCAKVTKSSRMAKILTTLTLLLTLCVGQIWAGQGYNGESHVYLNVDGTTKYYKVSTESWSTGSSLPGTWGGVLKDQTFSKVLNIQIKGGAVGGWTENGGNISGNLYYKVTNNTTTPSSGWITVGNINANYTTKSGNNCFRYKNDYSVNVTPTTPGTYYLHIKITDGDSNNRTSYVKITVPSFTVAGSTAVLGSDWDVTDTDNDMTFSSGTSYTLTKTNVTLATGTTYECKVVLNHNWDAGSYPGSNKTFTVAANGHYNVTFSFNASTKAVDVSTTRLYAVIYNDNGKTSGSVPATSYHANGATVTVASNSGSLAKTGYSFGGWNTNSSGTGTNYTAGSGTFTMGSSDKNLYAKWTANTYTITYKDQGGGNFSGTQTSAPTSHTYGTATTLKIPTKTGYMFGGWYTSSDCSTGAVGTSSSASLSATGYTANITLYAKWTAITVTSVSFSPSNTGTTDSHSFTMTFTTNVPTDNTYQYAIREFVTSASSYGAGYQIGATNIGAATITTASMNPAVFSSTGTYKTQIVILKGGSEVYSSSDYTYTVASASDPEWSMYNDNTNLGTFTNNGDNTYTLVVTIPAGGYNLTHYNNDQGFVGVTGAESLTTERTLVNNNGRIAWQDGAGTFRITIRKDGGTWKISAVRVYSVTYNGNGKTGGSVPTDDTYYTSGSTVTVKSNSGSLVRTNYSFGGWNTNASGTGANYTAGSGTFSIIADTELFAKWNETMHTVTVSRNSTTLGTVSTSSVSAGVSTASTTITATPVSGATFTGWTIPSGVTLASGTTSSASITINATADSKTIIANFSETTYTVNVALSDASQSNGTTNPNGDTQVGAITPVQITAPTPKTGFSSTGRWTTTGGVTVANATANPTTITATAAGTVRWTFDEDLTTAWKLRGSFVDDFATAYDFVKKSGESTGNVAYTTVTLSSNTTYRFKVINGSTWYGNNNSEGGGTYYIKGNVENWEFKTSDGNCYMTTTLAGTYTFKIDFSAANPKISVYYPEIYAISGDFNSWTETSNLVFDGNVGTATININGSATAYEFKVLENGVWCGATLNITGNVSNQQLTVGGGDNITLSADVYPNGDYTFTYNKSTHKLSVAYPTSYQISFERVPTAGGKTAPWANFTGNINDKQITSGVVKIADGATAYFYAATQSDHYTYYGWYSVNDAPKGTYTNRLVSTQRYSTTVTSSTPSNLYATYYDNDYNVSVVSSDATNAGTVAQSYMTAHKDKKETIPTATAKTGFYFYNWTKTGTATLYSNTSATAAQINGVTASDAVTVTANFLPKWSVASTATDPEWSTTANKFTTAYYQEDSKWKGNKTITLAANTEYELKMYDIQSTPHWYGTPHGSDEVHVHYAQSNNANDMSDTEESAKNLHLHTAAVGEYTFKWNVTDKSLQIVFPTSLYITTGQKTVGQDDSNGGSFTAVETTNSNVDVKGGKFVANNATVTCTATPNTGYTFGGWYSESTCTTAYVNGTGGAAISGEGGVVLTLSSITTNKDIYAKFTPRTYTITLTRTGTGYGSGGDATLTATYGAAFPAATMPTAAEGYAFMGYYSEANGAGTQFTNASGVLLANITDYSDESGNWKYDGTKTLYAYYKKAEITDITLNASIFEPVEVGDPDSYVTADPVIEPTPTPTTKLCWELRYSNDNKVEGRDPISVSGNKVKFLLNGLAAGGYKIHVELRTGSTCGAGELLSSFDKSFSIASDHIVTVQYKSGDFTLKAPTSVGGKPLDWSEVIEAASITGYTFNHWEAGEGVTIKDDEGEDKTTSTDATIQIKAIYDSKLTAVYNKKRVIYFYNTLGWSNVYVYFYKNDSYWGNDNQGSGANTTYTFTGTPYSEGLHGQMLPIEEGSSIYYFDAEAAGVNASYTNVVFTELAQHGCNYFYNNNKAVRRGDYQSTTLPMFVPLANQTPEDKNGGTAKYYNKGYWMNYPENTGYTLRIYNTWNADNATGASREYMIPFSTDKKMPLKQDVEINFSGETWFLIYRNDGNYLQGSHTFKQNDHGDKAMTSTSEAGSASKMKVISDAEGIYTFTLSFHGNGANPEVYSYYVNVEFPAAVGDYRIVYQDNATWSQSTAHDASWNHPSRVIPKIKGDATEDKKDTVSFFISVGSSPTMKFQKIESINATTGAVTWTDVASGSITIPSSITESGVYNFIVTQPVGGASISLEKAEPYTGNFYIRTDGAGSTKWDNYQASDHQMTYTEFSMSAANSFGDKYSHYFMHWSPGGTNIKFVVANDYSPCISDTLENDLHDWGNLNAGGQLKKDGDKSAIDDIYSANVRFMYNYKTNKISRAYVSSSTNRSRWFLVLRGDEVIKDENGTPVSDQGVTNGAILSDKENWIYERILQIKPDSRFKLFACYAEASPTQSGAQYFRGAYESGAWADDNSKSVILISGSGSYQKARVLYDFKTNRLVCAWLPSDEPIDETLDIDADVMVIRDHQEAAECITFSGSGSLTDVKTVYGAMKFNRWTLNNRYRGKGGVEDNNKDHCDSPADIAEYHSILPAGEQKSVYERSLYFISFPFDVKVSEIFGFGTYGKHWVLEYYDGLNRAKNGYWIDSPANWKYVTPSMAKTYELKAYEGYILCLSLGRMAYDNTEVWPNNISNVELYFPSKTPMTNIQTTNVNISGLNEIAGDPYRCTINREGEDGDRRIKDSYWRCLGVPSYNLYAGQLKEGEGGSTINWQTNYNTFPFLYAWNMTDNTLTPQATNAFSFKPMHAYLTQIGTAIYWKNVSATPASVIARQVEEPAEYNWRLTLNNGEDLIDQTYVRMSTDEVITNEFDFGQDLSKELNTGRSDIYSFIGNERAAANSLQMNTETTTVVRLGLNIEATGDYTFSIPDGTNGIGITLIDEETGIRTSLSALDYTVELAAGDYTERFWLEISPVKGAETGIDPGVDARENGVRKVMIDGILYIVKDGKMYDARGARVE